MMKRIVVCCDGTWNADDTQTDDTNAPSWPGPSTAPNKPAAFSKSCFTSGVSVPQG
jgi:hypothetical protein